MRSIASIGASIIVAVLLGAGLLALESVGGRPGVAFGGALAAGTLAAFLLTYDVLRRDGLAPSPAASERGGGEAKRPVRPRFDPEDISVIDAVPRGGTEYMNRIFADIKRDTVYILKIVLAPRVKYEHDALIEQLAVLGQRVPKSAYVYLVTADGHFVWFTRPAPLRRYLEDANDGRALIALINNGREDQFDSFSSLVSFRISRRSSNLSALRLLAIKEAAEAMIIHESRGTPIGPIDWGTLVMRVTPGETRSEIGS